MGECKLLQRIENVNFSKSYQKDEFSEVYKSGFFQRLMNDASDM
jgi:hypothetical protein